MTKVSVIIPAYNAMTYLPETVESVLKQTFADFEVLMINDGSSDHIVEWSSQIADPRVKLISQNNQGVSAARNTGITHAQGTYIAFLDADDLWESTKLEKQVHCLDRNSDVGLVYTWTALANQLGKPTGKMIAHSVEGKAWEQIITKDCIGNGSSPMVRYSCFKTTGVFDPNLSYAADWDMWIRIAESYPIAVLKEPLIYYRQYDNSMSKNRSKMVLDIRQVIEKAFQSAPLELLYLRSRSYGWLNICQSWNSLDEKNYPEAMHYQEQALVHHPQLRYTENNARLTLAITMAHWLGPHSYDGVRKLTRIVRKRILGIKLDAPSADS